MTTLRAALAANATAKRPGATFVVREPAFQQLREALGFGLLNAAHAIEGRAKANAPVAGGHRSTRPDGPVGGTLRRSLHSQAFVDGKPLIGSATEGSLLDEAGDLRDRLLSVTQGQPVVSARPAGAIASVVGTNVEYAGFVHDGTTRMVARPFLAEALAETADQVPGLIAAGARRHLGQSSGAAGRSTSTRARDARGRFISTRRQS